MFEKPIKGPLNGVRVIDLATYAAGPSASKLLAGWGADVIKVDTTQFISGGDFGSLYGVPTEQDEQPITDLVNSNKRHIRVDLKTPEGHEVMLRLLKTTDVIITNYRAGALVKLGMDYETLHEQFPGLVYGYVTGYGENGKDASKPGFDSTAYWARGGLMMSLGEPDAIPPVPLATFGDLSAGLALCAGVLAALYGKKVTGKGQKVIGSLYGTAVYQMGLELAAAAYHENPRKSVKHPTCPTINIYECSDGKWVSLTVLNYDKDYANFCDTLEHPELKTDPRCDSPVSLFMNCEELTALFAEIIKTKPRAEWCKRWDDSDIPYEILQTMDDVLNDQQALDNNYVIPVTFRSGNTAKMIGAPVFLSDVGSTSYNNLFPHWGGDTLDVIRELGYDQKTIDKFLADNIIKDVEE